MREILPQRLWIGHAGDLRDRAIFETHGIRALVHVALEEPIPEVSRELLLCHVPLMDGANAAGMLRNALSMTATLIRDELPTLVCCSAGMSRSPAVTAGAIALATGRDANECLAEIVRGHPHDVSPVLWDAVVQAVRPGCG